MTTYDDWKTTDRDAEDYGSEPPPCERGYPLRMQHKHPRYPSGYCVECGAEAHEECKYIPALTKGKQE